MPIVFVHGVTGRPGKEWEEQKKLRRSLFQSFALRGLVADPLATHYCEPMWGKFAAAPRWNHASLPTGHKYEEFDIEDDADAIAARNLLEAALEPVSGVASHRQLLEQTRRAAAQDRDEEDRQPLEALLDAILLAAAGPATEADLIALAPFAVRAADYAAATGEPAWLAEVDSDAGLLNRLIDSVEEWPGEEPPASASPTYEAFDFGDAAAWVKEAAGRVSGLSNRLAGRAFTAATRSWAHQRAALFLGDVVVYLNERGTYEKPGLIVNEVGDAIATAQGKCGPHDPKLMVVAHSMGGNIVYDILTHYRPELRVDVFVTVGSQVAFFEELAQFRSSPTDDELARLRSGSPGRPAGPEPYRIPKPANVEHWINVFDRNDMLGFAAAGVYRDVVDLVYSTGEGALDAHGAYLTLMSFHQRLRKRLQAVGW